MKVSSAHQPGRTIYGLIFLAARESGTPSWKLQYYESSRLFTFDLGIESEEAVMAAIADAAEFLKCRPENIQVGPGPLAESEVQDRARPSAVRLERVRGVRSPRARVYYAVEDVLRPGWYVQFHSDGQLDRLPLWQADLEDEEAARTEAAWLLGCRPEEIQIGGELLDWPE